MFNDHDLKVRNRVFGHAFGLITSFPPKCPQMTMTNLHPGLTVEHDVIHTTRS